MLPICNLHQLQKNSKIQKNLLCRHLQAIIRPLEASQMLLLRHPCTALCVNVHDVVDLKKQKYLKRLYQMSQRVG